MVFSQADMVPARNAVADSDQSPMNRTILMFVGALAKSRKGGGIRTTQRLLPASCDDRYAPFSERGTVSLLFKIPQPYDARRYFLILWRLVARYSREPRAHLFT